MRKLLNTLYVMTPGTYLSKEGLAVVASREQKEVARFPSHNLSSIVCFGRVSCSPYLMHFCAENDILISFLGEDGRFLARVEGPVSGNVLLRREQYRIADDPERARALTVMLLSGKLANSRAVLRRFLRDHGDLENVRKSENFLTVLLGLLKRVGSVEELRGVEGKGAERYFSVFQGLILNPAFEFGGRNRRPPQDEVNALLSFTYSIVLSEVVGALEIVGLDPAAGFLHCDRPGRPSLGLDLLEEFRSWLADRFVLSLINLKRVNVKDFSRNGNGSVLLNDNGRKIVVDAWQKRKREEFEHPYLGEKMPIGTLFFVQARLLARYIRGELDSYVPYIWK